MIHDAYVRRKYNAFTAYWPDFDWPAWDDIDFGFRSAPSEWGSVEFLPDKGIRLSMDPRCQTDSMTARCTLAHEMNHIYLGEKVGHGKRFNAAMLAALNRGLISENLI